MVLYKEKTIFFLFLFCRNYLFFLCHFSTQNFGISFVLSALVIVRIHIIISQDHLCDYIMTFICKFFPLYQHEVMNASSMAHSRRTFHIFLIFFGVYVHIILSNISRRLLYDSLHFASIIGFSSLSTYQKERKKIILLVVSELFVLPVSELFVLPLSLCFCFLFLYFMISYYVLHNVVCFLLMLHPGAIGQCYLTDVLFLPWKPFYRFHIKKINWCAVC
jgi:hypothetical protein